MFEPETDEPQPDAHAMRSDMSDRAFGVSDREIVRSVQVPRDGGDNADATQGARPKPEPAGGSGAA